MAVREHMITNHPHDNLFHAVPKLGIPSTPESYLVYDVSLDAEHYGRMILLNFGKNPWKATTKGRIAKTEQLA